MFIERSAAKIRGVRTLFVLAGVLPCAALVGWAVFRHSAAYRETLQRQAGQALGVTVGIGGVEHVRPGAMKLRGCTLATPAGGAMLVVPDVEVEASATEVRLKVPELECSPAAAAMLAAVARSWLEEPARFPRAWVVDIGALRWSLVAADGAEQPDGSPYRRLSLRIECVAAGDARAVRVFRPDGPVNDVEKNLDEVRVIASPAVAEGGPRYEVRGAVENPLPWAVVQAVVGGSPVGRLPLGATARVSGSMEAAFVENAWEGTARGLVDGIDLERVVAGSPHRLSGMATVAVGHVAWTAGRLTRFDATCTAGRGRIGQSLIEALVATCGCRAGAAYRSLAGDALRPFDELAVAVAIDRGGLRLTSAGGRDGALLRLQGLSMIDEPMGAVPVDQLAWLLGPGGAPVVPASAAAVWLMSVMPFSEKSPAHPTETAIRPVERPRTQGDF